MQRHAECEQKSTKISNLLFSSQSLFLLVLLYITQLKQFE